MCDDGRDLAEGVIGQGAAVTVHCPGEQDAEEGQNEQDDVDPDAPRLGVDGAAHQQDGLAPVLDAEERGDVVGQQGRGQLVVGFDGVAHQFAAVAQEVAPLGVAVGHFVDAEDPGDDGGDEVGFWKSHDSPLI